MLVAKVLAPHVYSQKISYCEPSHCLHQLLLLCLINKMEIEKLGCQPINALSALPSHFGNVENMDDLGKIISMRNWLV